MSYEAYLPGATAVGIAYKDGVVLGAERRITLGSFVRSKSGRKVFRVTGLATFPARMSVVASSKIR